jgi:carbonic anhydrase
VKLQMSIYGSNSSWGDQCGNSNQSPINLSQSASKPCDLLCDLVFDDAYISQANVIVSDEGLILQSQTGLGSCKYNGDSYNCQTLLVTHPSHHTIENIQADGEIIAIFNNPTGGILCVSSLFRVNPTQTSSSHFFNAFVPYANPNEPFTSISLGEQWGLFMMVPPAGAYFVYDGSLVVPPCQSATWVVFKSMINIDSNDFALLVKNVVPGSRPTQPVGDRTVYFNDVEQLSGGPMPHDGKTYMRCKRSGKKNEVKQIQPAGLKTKEEKHSKVKKWVDKQLEVNGFMDILGFFVQIISLVAGIYFAFDYRNDTRFMLPIVYGQKAAKWLRSLFGFESSSANFSTSVSSSPPV